MNAKPHRLPLTILLLSMCAVSPLSGAKLTKTKIGKATYYSDRRDGRNVALKGEKYDKNALTAAAHKSYPLGSIVKVTNLSNGKSVTVRINDRMNWRSRAIIDLSRRAAEEISMIHRGRVKVKIELLQAIP